jgi:hypothetical protein
MKHTDSYDKSTQRGGETPGKGPTTPRHANGSGRTWGCARRTARLYTHQPHTCGQALYPPRQGRTPERGTTWILPSDLLTKHPQPSSAALNTTKGPPIPAPSYLEVHDLPEGALGVGRVAEGVEALLQRHHLMTNIHNEHDPPRSVRTLGPGRETIGEALRALKSGQTG